MKKLILALCLLALPALAGTYGSRDMAPGLPGGDGGYRGSPHAIIPSDRGVGLARAQAHANVANVVCGKPRVPVPLTTGSPFRVCVPGVPVADTAASTATTLRALVCVVLSNRTEEKMVGSNARRIVAVVQDAKTGWYSAAKQLPRDSVGTVRVVEDSEVSVPRFIQAGRPQPASLGGVYLRHESSEEHGVGSGERDGRIEVSHGEPPQQVPVVRLGLSVSALGRAALHCMTVGVVQ